MEGRREHISRVSGGDGAGDFTPDRHGVSAKLAMVCGGREQAFRMKNEKIGDAVLS
jgi:hypothetical protein